MGEQRSHAVQRHLQQRSHVPGMCDSTRSNRVTRVLTVLASSPCLGAHAQVCSSVCSLAALSHMSLQYCHLSSVHPGVSSLVAIQSLDISHNLFYPEVCP